MSFCLALKRMHDSRHPDTVAVAIGRNEGPLLFDCLDSLFRQTPHIVYVDSGSTDRSIATARALDAEIVELDPAQPFTAARARNGGMARLAEEEGALYVQFIDGDCILQPGWIATARAALEADPGLAIVCGRRRERHPNASVYNRLIDREWDRPPGETKACGGDFMVRAEAFRQVGGFNPAVIAGEEPELCVRLRAAGWRILRLDAEMTLHDAAMHRFGQWWTRARRAGYAYALGAALHGAAPERHCVRELRSALVWGVALPAAILLGASITPWALAALAAYPLQIARIARRDGDWPYAAFLVLAKFAEAQGAARYAWDRLTGRAARIIEYK